MQIVQLDIGQMEVARKRGWKVKHMDASGTLKGRV